MADDGRTGCGMTLFRRSGDSFPCTAHDVAGHHYGMSPEGEKFVVFKRGSLERALLVVMLDEDAQRDIASSDGSPDWTPAIKEWVEHGIVSLIHKLAAAVVESPWLAHALETAHSMGALSANELLESMLGISPASERTRT